jgi:hypothetical protein
MSTNSNLAVAFITCALSVTFLFYLGIYARLDSPGLHKFYSLLSKYSSATRKQGNSSITGSLLLAKSETKFLNPIDHDQNGGDPNFRRVMTKAEIKHFVDIFRKFDELSEKAGLVYFMAGGTLLGSYRNFGFLPWDDDIDILVSQKDKNKTLKALTVPGYNCITGVKRWKFDDKSDKLIKSSKTRRWPFLDINFYKENSTHLWNDDTFHYADNVYRKDWIFPLRKRPFEGYWFYAPKNTGKCLMQHIDLSVCMTRTWNHRFEHGISKSYKIKCDKLRPYFAFVNRTRLRDGRVTETLALGSRVLHEVVLDGL